MAVSCEVVGFSAARYLPAGAEVIISAALMAAVPSREPGFYLYVTGGAVGGDTYIGKLLARTFREDYHQVVVPDNTSQVSYWWEEPEFAGLRTSRHLQVLRMPAGTRYKDRNAKIVEASDRLACFPAFAEGDKRSRGSGTWQTIRLARKAFIPVSWWALDGHDVGVSSADQGGSGGQDVEVSSADQGGSGGQ